ncbi:hypothetical protein Ancab_005241 [Ancistrocladus abbreviatus]
MAIQRMEIQRMAVSKVAMSCIATFFICLLLLKGVHLNVTKSNAITTDVITDSHQGRKLGGINYGALQRGDSIPCRAGTKCKKMGPPASPYTRGCEASNRCRHG